MVTATNNSAHLLHIINSEFTPKLAENITKMVRLNLSVYVSLASVNNHKQVHYCIWLKPFELQAWFNL